MGLITVPDLLNDALKKSGEKTDGTSDYLNDALGYMDTFHKSIIAGGNEFEVDMGEPWTWAKSKYPGILTLNPPYITGGVTLTLGSSAGIFTVPPITSQAGNFIHCSDTFEFYRVVSHTAGNPNFTLDGPVNFSSGTYDFKSIQVDYDLSAANILRQINPMVVYQQQTSDGDFEGRITGLDLRTFQKKWPMFKMFLGVPTEFAVLYVAQGLVTVRMNKVASVPVRVEYEYIPLPVDLINDPSSIPLIPVSHREVLAYATAFSILTDKEDSKSQSFYTLTQNKLKSLVSANRKEFMQISKNRGRLVARGDDSGVRFWPTSGT